MHHCTNAVLFFDGDCNLCNNAVQFVIRHDKRQRFRFASLQSLAGQNACMDTHMAQAGSGTFILWLNGKYYTRSTAALKTARLLNGLYPLLYIAIIIPRFLRDAVYDLISRKRYKWFGKRNTCMMPSPELAKRFI